jgi:hypothetical protein
MRTANDGKHVDSLCSSWSSLAVRDGRSMLDVAIAGIKSSLIFRRCHPRLTMGLIIDHSRFSPLVGAKVE